MKNQKFASTAGLLCLIFLHGITAIGQENVNITGTATINAIIATTGAITALSSTTASTNNLTVSGTTTLGNLTVSGPVEISGEVDFSNNSLYFGSWATDPNQYGINLLYTDGTSVSVPSRLTINAERPFHEWVWAHQKTDRSGTIPAMKLSANHVLTINNLDGTPALVLDPSSPNNSTTVLTQLAGDGRYVRSDSFHIGWASTPEYGEAFNIAFASGTATGVGSLAGISSIASGAYSVAFGLEATAAGDESIALGTGATPAGLGSIAIGTSTYAGESSIALGLGAVATGTNSVAIGFLPTASGLATVSIGSGEADGYGSVSLGYDTSAKGLFQTVVGVNNKPQGNPIVWVPDDDLFTVGNGSCNYIWFTPIYDQNGNRFSGGPSNAFVVKKSGDTTVYGKFTVSANNGSKVATPSGFSIAYSDGTNGVNSAIIQTATRPSSSWSWNRTAISGTSITAMQLDATNRLILTGTDGTSPGRIVLDPNAGSSSIGGAVKITGALIVTGTLDGSTNTVVASGTNQLVLIPQQGDLSMGNFTAGATPQ